MNRTLEEILNTPVEFKEGMRVFSLRDFIFIKIKHIEQRYEYPIIALREGSNDRHSFTLDGKYHKDRAFRDLLTEQEAYELFPSLRPKVYEYKVLYMAKGRYYLSWGHYESQEEFREKYKYEGCEFIELYQPSKRERKA